MRRFILLVSQPVTLLLFLTTLVVTRGMGQGEFFFYNDEMYHAMTGVFFVMPSSTCRSATLCNTYSSTTRNIPLSAYPTGHLCSIW